MEGLGNTSRVSPRGGTDTLVFPSGGGRYDPVANTWTPTTTVGVPSGRFNHTAVWTGSGMIVWGGNVAFGLNDGGQWRTVSLYAKN